jgi:hypothetical protein
MLVPFLQIMLFNFRGVKCLFFKKKCWIYVMHDITLIEVWIVLLFFVLWYEIKRNFLNGFNWDSRMYVMSCVSVENLIYIICEKT